LVALLLYGAPGARVAGAERVVVEAVDGQVLVEPEQARLPFEAVAGLGLDAELLRDLAMLRQPVGRFRRDPDQPRPGQLRRQERRAIAAVDVAAVERFHRLVAGDRVQ